MPTYKIWHSIVEREVLQQLCIVKGKIQAAEMWLPCLLEGRTQLWETNWNILVTYKLKLFSN